MNPQNIIHEQEAAEVLNEAFSAKSMSGNQGELSDALKALEIIAIRDLNIAVNKLYFEIHDEIERKKR